MATPDDSYDENSDTLSGDAPVERQHRPVQRAPPENAGLIQRGKRVPRASRKLADAAAAARPPISSDAFTSPTGRNGRGRAGSGQGRSSATASPVPSETSQPQEPSSAQKRKRRRLAYPDADDSAAADTWRPGPTAGVAGRGRQERLHGDIGEGVSALLSLGLSVPDAGPSDSQGGQPGGGRGEPRRPARRPVRDVGEPEPLPRTSSSPLLRAGRRGSQALDDPPDGQYPHQRSPGRRGDTSSFASPIKAHSALEPPRSQLLLQARRGDPAAPLFSPPQNRRGARGDREAALPQGEGAQGGGGGGSGGGSHPLAATIIGNQNVVENQSVFWSWLTKQSASDAGDNAHQRHAAGADDGTSSGDDPRAHSGGELPAFGRRHKRKPVPERLPVTLCAAKYAFTRSLLPSSQNYGSKYKGSRPQARGAAPIGETGEPMSGAELRLRHCLSSRVRRWAGYEFHYSAIDRPWFLRNELQEFLHHLGIAHVTSLTRTEWSIIRSAFGKPRRFSAAYLADERAKLEAYREQVRNKYQEVGIGMEVPPDLPRPLRVGQEVTARHPQTRQLHDGSILTCKGSKYRVQFARSDLLTEVVPDVDVMPVDPSENLPLTLASLPLLLNGRMNAGATGQFFRRRTSVMPVRGPAAGRAQQEARGPADERAREVDARALLELATSLDMKEALLRSLRDFNDMASAGHLDKNAQQMQHSYAQLILQLQSVNRQVQTALGALQDRPQLYAAAQKLLQSRGHPTDPDAAAHALAATAPPPHDPQLEATNIVNSAAAEATALVSKHCPPHPTLEQQQSAAAAAAAMAAAATAAVDQPGPTAAAAGVATTPAASPSATAPAAASSTAAAAAAALREPAVLRRLARRQRQLLQREDQCLAETICGCLGILFTVQKCTSGFVSGPGVAAALDLALNTLQPRAAANKELYQQIVDAVATLKTHLTVSPTAAS